MLPCQLYRNWEDHVTLIIDANSIKIKKDTSKLKIGEVILTPTGYAKVVCLNPIKGISIVRGEKHD